VFDAIYSRSLIYNACWEDPAVDRQALGIAPGDRMLVITSAGCNVLDYALAGPAAIHAVDANPRQNALLELKLAGIRRLAFDDFFLLFGAGAIQGSTSSTASCSATSCRRSPAPSGIATAGGSATPTPATRSTTAGSPDSSPAASAAISR
jgi:S-adenosylmethionine-diacylglycerol 3-amino-3-carboxypropyl transferase